jgi:hypothetical protein
LTGINKTKFRKSGWEDLQLPGKTPPDGWIEANAATAVWKPDMYPKNCLPIWSADVKVPDPDEVTATLLKCLLWAQADPETPEFMIQGRRDFYNKNILSFPKDRALLKRFVPIGSLAL